MDQLISINAAQRANTSCSALSAVSDIALDLANIVFNSTQEAIVVTDNRGTVIGVNPAFTAITGYSALEIVGKNMRSLQSGRHQKSFYQDIWSHVTRSGYWQGEIWNRRKHGDVYPALLTISSVRNRVGEPTYYVGTSVDLSRIKKSELELDHFAHHDELTQLPNRRSLLLRLNQALERANKESVTGAVIFVDLDRFKLVNDSLGHGAGDELLTLAAQRIKEALRANDFMARFGGDEFIVLLEQATRNAAEKVAASLIKRLSKPFVLSSGHEVCIGASVGMSFFPGDSNNPETLLQQADTALYQAKTAGKSTHRSYSPDLTAGASVRLTLEIQLRRALDRNELALHYQPLVSLADKQIFGFEALLRWDDPARGLVPPADFLPVAEETGLMVPIGGWVLQSACAQMRRIIDQGGSVTSMAVNISARQIRHPEFAASVVTALHKASLAPQYLELEITEGALVSNDDATIATLSFLRSIGVRIAIDDFGTGYSSLSYLKKLPFDTLKIDRSFVTDIGSDAVSKAIVTAVISLAQCLGREVLAEGIESEQQRELLLASGCTLGQGYLFSPPVSENALLGLSGLKRRDRLTPTICARD
ncbi:putative bifunctional diguanylate cyclase/phosphodiesterase [Hyphomicrobium sp.]|uniref:putative bifunctional diguanylate cyclase/phosphodiesterase n=1 Tax=Hyphomicrobium sp. TaxID=82 RepID=UPI002E3735D2|nr:EAL domain-containing protein [Hyphomicrobium sp.]HEX2842265.1 EAL domain-containing protein [Hyphomicrobium sp.]